jgi:hypothetical protein
VWCITQPLLCKSESGRFVTRPKSFEQILLHPFSFSPPSYDTSVMPDDSNTAAAGSFESFESTHYSSYRTECDNTQHSSDEASLLDSDQSQPHLRSSCQKATQQEDVPKSKQSSISLLVIGSYLAGSKELNIAKSC